MITSGMSAIFPVETKANDLKPNRQGGEDRWMATAVAELSDRGIKRDGR